MLRMLVWVAMGLIIFGIGCDGNDNSGGDKPAASTVEQATPDGVSEKPKLLFFMNPRGMPCRTQDGIVKEVVAASEGRVNLVYVKTHNESDRQVFYQYGIRSLPCLVLTKADGTVIKRFSPGVQPANTIREAIDALK